MKNIVYFIKNDWNSDTLCATEQAWVNDGRCTFASEAEAVAALKHREMIAPDEKSRVRVDACEYEIE